MQVQSQKTNADHSLQTALNFNSLQY